MAKAPPLPLCGVFQVLAPDVDLELVARRTPGFTGADLQNVMNEAAILTGAREGLHRVDGGWEGTDRYRRIYFYLFLWLACGSPAVQFLSSHSEVWRVYLFLLWGVKGLGFVKKGPKFFPLAAPNPTARRGKTQVGNDGQGPVLPPCS